MTIRQSDQRCIRSYSEYPGGHVWRDCEYRCPECGQWSAGSDVTQVHDDGTESMLCESCAAKVSAEIELEKSQ